MGKGNLKDKSGIIMNKNISFVSPVLEALHSILKCSYISLYSEDASNDELQ